MYAHLVQRSPEWFAARKLFKITCSEFSAALGINPYTSKHKLLKSKLHPELIAPHSDFTKNILKKGEDGEPIARADLESFLGITILEEGLHFNQIYEHVAGSHDGFVPEWNAIIEIKVKTKGVLPDHPDPCYIVQCWGNMEMRQADFCLLTYWAESGELRFWNLKRNTKAFNNIVWPSLLDFMQKLETGQTYCKMSQLEKIRLEENILKEAGDFKF